MGFSHHESDHFSAGFKHIHIQEHTILDAFEDFFQYVMESTLVYSREETIAEIERSIQILKNMSASFNNETQTPIGAI